MRFSRSKGKERIRAAYRRQKSYEHLSKRQCTFKDCARVLLDIRYLVRHSIPNWSGRLPLNPVQRPRATFFFLFFPRHCRSLVLSHHPPQATLPDAREKRRERGRGGIEKRERVRIFQVEQAVVDTSMKLCQDS